MGFIFDVDDVTVWNPSLRVGQIFVGYVETLEKVTGTSTGFSFMASDFIDIDIKQLTEFHAALISLLRSNNVLLHEQVQPILAIVVVLLRRGGSPPNADPADVGEGFADYLTRMDNAIGTL